MKMIFKYLRYLVRHKIYVARECFKLGLVWRGLVHDLSKFRPSEFMPYARYFYGKIKDDTKEKFDKAWLYHQKRNPHHWQFFILVHDDGGPDTIMEMPEKYRKEMLADWVGAGKAQGKVSPINDPFFECRVWYYKKKDNIKLGKNTRSYIEEALAVKKMKLL